MNQKKYPNREEVKKSMKANKQVKTVVGYARSATIVQSSEPNSIETQEKRIKEYCRKNKIELTAVYFDLGKSGIKLDRPGLNTLLSLVRNGKVKSVICTSPDRISRKSTDSLAVRVLLRRYGADLIFTDNKILDEEPYTQIIGAVIKAATALDLKKSRSLRGMGK